MTENQEVRHITVGQKYHIHFEQAASTKGQLGFKVEVNGDDREAAMTEAVILLNQAKTHAPQLEASKEATK